MITLILDLYRNQHMYIKLHSPSYEPDSDCDHLIPLDHPFSTVSEMIPLQHLTWLDENDCVVTKIRTWTAGQKGYCRSGFNSADMKGPLYSNYVFFCKAFLLNDKNFGNSLIKNQPLMCHEACLLHPARHPLSL